MAYYLTVDSLKQHLNIEHYRDDEYLATVCDAAEAAVGNYIQQPLADVCDSEGELPAPLLHAMKLFAGTLYANRESVTFGSPTTLRAYHDLLTPYIKFV